MGLKGQTTGGTAEKPPAGEADLPLRTVDRDHTTEDHATRDMAIAVAKRARFIPLIMALVATGGVIGLYFQPPGLQKLMAILKLQPGGGTSSPIAVPVNPSGKAQANNQVPRAPVVVGLGKLLPSGDVVTIAPPFGAGDARIATVDVGEGDRITRGALLATLDNKHAIEAAAASARATLAAREAALAQTRATVRASRDEARAALERAEATALNAARDLERSEKLMKGGYTTEAAYLQKKTAREETMREVQRAKATLSRWEATDPNQQPDVLLAARNVDAAKADLARAEGDLDKAVVKSPVDGTVLTIHIRAGEKPAAQGIMNVGNIDKMTAEIEIYQTQIGQVAIGDTVTLSAEALAQPLTGTVRRLGLEVGRQVLTEANPAANTDARVVKVYADLDAASSERAKRYTNLQVTARITVKGAQ